jgi:hypothetical protein
MKTKGRQPAMKGSAILDPIPTRTRRLASGNWNPDWEPFATLDPAWTEKAIALAIAPAQLAPSTRKRSS